MIDRNSFLKEIKNREPHLGLLLESLFDQIDGVATNAGVTAKGKLQPPPPVQAINVKAGTDHVHVTLTHSTPISKGVNYFVEYSVNDPSFQNPHVEHIGTSRGRVLALPAKDDAGVALNYFFRAYPQYPGSDAQTKKTVFGGLYTAKAVQLAGSSKLSLLASPGAGTAAPDGSQPGLGFGTDLARLAIGPKRQVPVKAF